MVRRLGEPGDEASRHVYRQRWKVGTVMSVVKRRWGEGLSARIGPTRQAQARCSGGWSTT